MKGARGCHSVRRASKACHGDVGLLCHTRAVARRPCVFREHHCPCRQMTNLVAGGELDFARQQDHELSGWCRVRRILPSLRHMEHQEARCLHWMRNSQWRSRRCEGLVHELELDVLEACTPVRIVEQAQVPHGLSLSRRNGVGPSCGSAWPSGHCSTLASGGMLFLALGEFDADILDALRQPLEEGVVRVSRALRAKRRDTAVIHTAEVAGSKPASPTPHHSVGFDAGPARSVRSGSSGQITSSREGSRHHAPKDDRR